MNFLLNYPSVALAFVVILSCAARWFLVAADRKRTEWLLAVACLSIPLFATAEAIANFISRFRPLKLDEFIYVIDRSFGQPSFVLGRLVVHHVTLHAIVSVTYGLLPIMLVTVFAVHLWVRSERDALQVLKIFAVNLLAAVPLYLLFPVCGPAFAFPQFPFVGLHGAPQLLALAAAPNGVPSVHTSSALLILWLLRPWRLGRVVGGVFLALTVFATLGSGQHYFFDLLCAVPYATAVVFVCTRWTVTPVVLAEEVAR